MLQNGIADLMTVGVVHGLKMIHIHDNQAQRKIRSCYGAEGGKIARELSCFRYTHL